jgi:hypothetical protein
VYFTKADYLFFGQNKYKAFAKYNCRTLLNINIVRQF